MTVIVHPLTPDRWDDLESIFNAKGCSIARGCWCMYYRCSGKSADLHAGQTQSALNRNDLKALAASDTPSGLIGYEGGAPQAGSPGGPPSTRPEMSQPGPKGLPRSMVSLWSQFAFHMQRDCFRF